MTGPVYIKYDKISGIQENSLSADEIETNIEDSVISYGEKELEEVKDHTHKKNDKKG